MQRRSLKNSINIGNNGEYFYIGDYIPHSKKAPSFFLDEYSELILKYKKGNYKIISFFAGILIGIIYNYLYHYDLILSIPSSNSYLDNYPNGIICSYLAFMGLIGYMKGGIVCVKGHSPKHIMGKDILENSMSIKNTDKFRAKNIILFDDIVTTGTTFRTVKQMLLGKGANSVTGLFLGKTISQVNSFGYNGSQTRGF